MKAVYALVLELGGRREIEVGALGSIEFPAGTYVYIGSAMNSVEKRLERHFSDLENLHWHIDYFTEFAEPVDYLILPENSDYECVLAEAARKTGEAVSGFGCSDCGCISHLFRFSSR